MVHRTIVGINRCVIRSSQSDSGRLPQDPRPVIRHMYCRDAAEYLTLDGF